MAKPPQSIASYLQPGRLADVLAMIQVLAFDRLSYRSEQGLRGELQRLPLVGASWMDVAREHPEFFRVRSDPDKDPRAGLLARFVLDREALPDGEQRRPPLDIPIANKLMELAVELHDKQLDRRDRWKIVALPIVVSMIAAGAAIGAATIGILSK